MWHGHWLMQELLSFDMHWQNFMMAIKMRAFACAHTQRRLHKSHPFHFGCRAAVIFSFMASIMSTKPTDKFRQTIIVMLALFVRLSSTLFVALLIFHPNFIPRKTHKNKPFLFATSSLLCGRSSSSISHFSNKQHRNYIGFFRLD